jgi:hypothetical protein
MRRWSSAALGIPLLFGAIAVDAAPAPVAASPPPHHRTVVTAASRDPRKSNPRPAVLSAVSCTSAKNCMTVGSVGSLPLAESWNGKKWSAAPVKGPAGTRSSTLLGVSCVSARWCVAVGSSFDGRVVDTLVETWNGKAWKSDRTPNPLGAQGGQGEGSTLAGVSCASATACEAVGSYAAKHSYLHLTLAEIWNGKTWKLEHTLNPGRATAAGLASVSCPRASDCTAVGYSGLRTLAEVWNGRSWRSLRTPNPAGALTSTFSSVSCPRMATCVAVASDGSSSAGARSFAEVWNGRVWQLKQTPSPAGSLSTSLFGVSCTSTKSCTAAAGLEASRGLRQTFAEAWNAKSWKLERTPDPSGGTEPAFAGISCPVAATCTAVGSYDRGATLTLAETWNGKTWKIERTPQ